MDGVLEGGWWGAGAAGKLAAGVADGWGAEERKADGEGTGGTALREAEAPSDDRLRSGKACASLWS